jgi:hypothetical protein
MSRLKGRESTMHPLRQQLDANLAQIFSAETNIANDWMKVICDDIVCSCEVGALKATVETARARSKSG